MGIKFREFKETIVASGVAVEGIIDDPAVTNVKIVEIPHLNEAFNSIIKFITDNKKYINELNSLLSDQGLTIKAAAPAALWKVEDRTVQCMSNIRLEWDKSISSIDVILANMTKEECHIKDQIIALKSKGVPDLTWSNPMSRTALLTKRASLTLEQFITRHTTAIDLGWADSRIAEIATRIRNATSELKLVICERPEDYCIMFDTPTRSCMDMNCNYGGGYGHAFWKKMREEFGIHPASWYHYTKSSKGCYISCSKTDKPIARAMLYADKDGVFNTYADLKFAMGSAANRQAGIKLLQDAGFTQRVYGLWAPKEDFRIPGIPHDKQYLCPLPYGDNVKKPSMNISFDDITHEFVFSVAPRDGIALTDMYAYNGYIKSSTIPVYKPKEIISEVCIAA